MSTTTISKRHEAKAVQDTSGIPGWQAHCTCGWTGRKHYTRGAKGSAAADALNHEWDMEEEGAGE